MLFRSRSAGIPLAFCAILHGEALQSLSIHPYLTQVIEFLMNLIISPPPECNDEEMSVVHAFNVLRAILTDRILGPRLDPWIASYFNLTIDRLSSGSWAIRNAASLSYSVLLRRTLGVSKQDVEERSKGTSTTFSILFSRLPSLYPYLLQKLKELLAHLDQSGTSLKGRTGPDGDASTLFITQTSLYSLLILLSRLSPSEVVDRKSVV